ncbi:MAG: protein translocase subunit SecF [bacterium]
MLQFIKYRKIWYIFSSILLLASIASLFVYKLNLGIDFTGGSILEVNGTINELPKDIKFDIQKTQNGAILRFKPVDEETHQRILEKIGAEEVQFESMGPVIGRELKSKAFWAIGIVVILIIFYIAFAFRKIQNPFKYGLIAVIALCHDVLISVGAFSFLNLEINTAFIAAILTVLGYSVNDTIIVFDRIRENMIKLPKEDLGIIINKSINQTLRRSIFTSLTVILTLMAILFFGGETIKSFALALIIGITIGTYSSIFIASPLLITLKRPVEIKK